MHDERPQYLAAILAFLLPGLGHAYLGRVRRGAMVAAGVLGLFFTGMLVAGIGAVDSGLWYMDQARKLTGSKAAPYAKVEGDAIWFLGEMFVGPIAFGVDLIHQYRFKVEDDRGVLRAAWPHEIRDPRNGHAVAVRNLDGSPREFTDPVSGQKRMGTPSDRPPYIKPLGRVAEVGTLFCTIAGIMNLIAIIDCAYSHKGREKPATTGGGT